MLKIYTNLVKTVVGRNRELKAILSAIDAGKHILLEGPPGTSKSTILRNIAREAKMPFYIIEGNIDLTPGKLVGHFNPAKVMADDYRPEYFEKGPLTKAMEEGGILYIEEFNRMPADVSNVLITPMEEGELFIPRYGTVKAADRFTVVASQNPYDDVGTVRVSRAFMDRICLIKMEYQPQQEEEIIVKRKTGCTDQRIIELAVKFVRKTREHPDIKMGASVRAAIDIVDIFNSLQKLDTFIDENILTAARMALGNKIWLNEITTKTVDKIIEAIWEDLRADVSNLKELNEGNVGAVSSHNGPPAINGEKELKKRNLV
ncbi:ATPase AAA [Thermincola ferriacetica]|uniref:ATPase AAA n=1 Tax=Thermincola ferriacetica TaxID=281456 RepID=A0A0L6VZM1_9FIRM|nr:MoxR family ATPase [Thermincola ferriacetica]KNZ68777.1 ATPase AAA [Thermincola ferriacetica]